MGPKSLKEQIKASKQRLQIHDDEWKFSFIENLPADLHQRLTKNREDQGNKFDPKIFRQNTKISSKSIASMDFSKNDRNARKVKGEEEKRNYTEDEEMRGDKYKVYQVESVLKEITLLEATHSGNSSYAIWIIITRCVLQLIYQFHTGGDTFNLPWYEYILTFWNLLAIFVVYGTNLIFIYAGLIDFKRKLFFMKILQSIISPNKERNFAFSNYFPTINSC